MLVVAPMSEPGKSRGAEEGMPIREGFERFLTWLGGSDSKQVAPRAERRREARERRRGGGSGKPVVRPPRLDDKD